MTGIGDELHAGNYLLFIEAWSSGSQPEGRRLKSCPIKNLDTFNKPPSHVTHIEAVANLTVIEPNEVHGEDIYF